MVLHAVNFQHGFGINSQATFTGWTPTISCTSACRIVFLRMYSVLEAYKANSKYINSFREQVRTGH